MLHVVLVAFLGAGNAAFPAKMAEPLDELGMLGDERHTHFAEGSAIPIESNTGGERGSIGFSKASFGTILAFLSTVFACFQT
jgi:hypothetical protein